MPQCMHGVTMWLCDIVTMWQTSVTLCEDKNRSVWDLIWTQSHGKQLQTTPVLNRHLVLGWVKVMPMSSGAQIKASGKWWCSICGVYLLVDSVDSLLRANEYIQHSIKSQHVHWQQVGLDTILYHLLQTFKISPTQSTFLPLLDSLGYDLRLVYERCSHQGADLNRYPTPLFTEMVCMW